VSSNVGHSEGKGTLAEILKNLVTTKEIYVIAVEEKKCA
jgi:hypothetical protein